MTEHAPTPTPCCDCPPSEQGSTIRGLVALGEQTNPVYDRELAPGRRAEARDQIASHRPGRGSGVDWGQYQESGTHAVIAPLHGSRFECSGRIRSCPAKPLPPVRKTRMKDFSSAGCTNASTSLRERRALGENGWTGPAHAALQPVRSWIRGLLCCGPMAGGRKVFVLKERSLVEAPAGHEHGRMERINRRTSCSVKDVAMFATTAVRRQTSQRLPAASSRSALTRARPKVFLPPSVYPALRFHRRPS
ncbi:hypothetical protein E1295_20090 [Nonomuraea mesophila]|uniref:Uncharacterized protein n=1 Tax=Nonomuraea mesophila TaxID=2530382 RepID=A0A4R5FGQ0_9ACTN|nr:hypothetical protein E1295_20090 [Nonomuraea mesophila]